MNVEAILDNITPKAAAELLGIRPSTLSQLYRGFDQKKKDGKMYFIRPQLLEGVHWDYLRDARNRMITVFYRDKLIEWKKERK